ncbi:MAG: tmRNA-binding protein SmpB [Brockia lithotrophica]|uniref:SsrA-binding protein n=1 Tax=Brockia lithotrophica TaxID=933949 RepID=A0A2T5G3Y8_9BACL|nr:SsrA-binding protein SmpB [Brockia lithotrophica]MBT9252569.1 SsrA-binding protein SmpB [Brockia lithotrophica]PTQ50903.1 MAG: tmRNA-binding protein SmpB [Brockia lithotrophica]
MGGERRVFAENRKAFHDYHIEERYEAGISLLGSEVKAVRQGRVNLRDSYVRIRDGEAYVVGMHISPYEKASAFVPDPTRTRKLLMHRREIERLMGKVQTEGYTIVPLSLYGKGRWIKLEIGLAKGKKLHDKREALRERAVRREIERTLKTKNR